MHIPDGLLDMRTWAGCWAVSAIGLAAVVRQSNRTKGTGWLPLAGVMGAYLFVAQMINFPIGGGTSGHLLGSALAAIVLGPALGAIVLASVLVIQALVFQDGGVMALGANMLNMAFAAAFLGYLIYRVVGRIGLPSRLRVAVGGFLAGWVSVVFAAALASFELALSGVFPFRKTFLIMTSVHAVIGVGEGIITAGLLYFIYATKPHVVRTETEGRLKLAELLGMGIFLLAVIALVAPLASSAPDGLEKSIEALGLAEHLGTPPLYSALADYQVPGVGSPYLSTILSGLIGVLIILLITLGIVKLRGGKKYEPSDS
jgi:cobalt/nickel transport system permease protein